MGIHEFIELEHKALNQFKEYWKKNSEETPEFYPKSMGEGDWLEQFNSFLETGFDPEKDLD